MGFIMRLFTKNNVLAKPKQPALFWGAGCLRVFVLMIGLMTLPVAHAENIQPTRREAQILPNGQLAISTRFATELPEQLTDALQQGVSLDFELSYQLERPTFASYRSKITQLVSNENRVNYRLSYHPLTSRYRVSVGTFSTEYSSLTTALKAVGAIANWHTLKQGTLLNATPSDVEASIRLSLSTSKLPKPFQINALTLRDWNLDSGWQDLIIR